MMNDTPLQIPCPHCAAVNRVPMARLIDQPRCGRCREAVFVSEPLALDGNRFDLHAQHSSLPLLIDFWAPWCQPCLAMAPQFTAAAALLEPRLRLAKVDTEAEPALASRFAIRSIPTLVLIDAGRELARQSGGMSRDQIVAWTRSQLAARSA